MQTSDWIQIALSIITLLGLATVWIQPGLKRRKEKRIQLDRVKKRISLYLDVLEIKLERELSLIDTGRRSSIEQKEFEQENQINYNALEIILREADVLNEEEYNEFMEFVRYFKISENMKSKSDLETSLGRIKNRKLRDMFREGANLKQAIEEAKCYVNNLIE